MNDYQPGELIIIGKPCEHEIGFYRGLGSNTIQYYTADSIVRCNKLNQKTWTSYIGGSYKERRVARYHPDLVTEIREKEKLEKALEIIREKNILPIKY